MKQNRVISGAVAALVLAALLAGCGSTATGASSADSTPAATEAAGSEATAPTAEPQTEAALPDGVYTAEFETDSSMVHANEACDGGRVTVNGKVARASYDVKVGDVIALHFGERVLAVEVLDVSETAGKSEASLLYREVNAQ